MPDPKESLRDRNDGTERRLRKWEEEDRKREAKRRAEFERRGEPQRFTLRGMVYHPDPTRQGDGSWTLPDIDPTPERNEVIPVREDYITDADLLAVSSTIDGRKKSYPLSDYDEKIAVAVCEAVLLSGRRRNDA